MIALSDKKIVYMQRCNHCKYFNGPLLGTCKLHWSLVFNNESCDEGEMDPNWLQALRQGQPGISNQKLEEVT